MKQSILSGKRILAVDDEPDVLTVIEEEVCHEVPDVVIEKAGTFDEAAGLLRSKEYDLVILDIMGVGGFDLLEIAVSRGFKAAMLTAHALSAEALKKSRDLGARAYLPKDKLGELVPFLEDVLEYEPATGWKRLLEKLEDYYDKRFGPDWQKKVGWY
jgi:DNA-binding response OmpR family regulator